MFSGWPPILPCATGKSVAGAAARDFDFSVFGCTNPLVFCFRTSLSVNREQLRPSSQLAPYSMPGSAAAVNASNVEYALGGGEQNAGGYDTTSPAGGDKSAKENYVESCGCNSSDGWFKANQTEILAGVTTALTVVPTTIAFAFLGSLSALLYRSFVVLLPLAVRNLHLFGTIQAIFPLRLGSLARGLWDSFLPSLAAARR